MTQDPSLLSICITALISMSLIGFGVHGRREQIGSPRRVRTIPICVGVCGIIASLYIAPTHSRLGGSAWLIGFVVAVMVGLNIGSILVVRGWRGQRIGDHPHCRACGFDLFGRDEGTPVCVECGAHLGDRAAVVIGVRKRGFVALSGGIVLLVTILGSLATFGSPVLEKLRAHGTAYYMPLSSLTFDYGIYPSGESATREVDRRLASGEFDQADFESFAEWVLADSVTSPNHQRQFVYTRLAFAGWARGLLSEPTMRRLVRQTAKFQLHAPEFVKADEVLVQPWCVLNNIVLGPVKLQLDVDYRQGQILVGDQIHAWEDRRIPSSGLSLSRLVTPTHTKAVLPDWAVPSSAVEAQITWKAKATIRISGPMCPLIEEEVDATAVAMTLIVSDGQLIRPDSSSQYNGPINAKAEVRVKQSASGRYSLDVSINTQPELTFIGDLYLMKGEEEALLGPIVFNEGGISTHLGEYVAFPDEPFSLILKPVPSRGMDSLSRQPTYQKQIDIETPSVFRDSRIR